jgi:hypothetical protein
MKKSGVTKKPKGAANGERSTAIKSKVRSEATKVVLLSGGNPQIAKGEGDAPVQAYIAAMPGWKRGAGQRLDAIVVRNVASRAMAGSSRSTSLPTTSK